MELSFDEILLSSFVFCHACIDYLFKYQSKNTLMPWVTHREASQITGKLSKRGEIKDYKAGLFGIGAIRAWNRSMLVMMKTIKCFGEIGTSTEGTMKMNHRTETSTSME